MYEATITTDHPNYGEKVYKGITEPKFKARYGNHKKSFNHRKYMKESELSKEVWKLKGENANYTITWRVIKQYAAYNQNTKRCPLCLNEKLAIIEHDGKNLLNKRSEIISKCRHQNKYKLANLTSSQSMTSDDNIT